MNNYIFKHTVVTKCIGIAVCTRNRNWDNTEYHEGVVVPYRKILKLQQKIESENRVPCHDERKQALQMLRSVFETKKVPKQEQRKRFREIMEVTGERELIGETGLLS